MSLRIVNCLVMVVLAATLVLLTTMTTPVNGGVLVREERAMSKNSSREICMENIPCGWAIYTPFTRDINYLVRSACVCPVGVKCIRVSDDLSVSAYVYHCETKEVS